ncbi:ABC transporter substrate-binding protein [Mongoliimonas terrestris]|uniref:ABC transporter substrate-binding protein n=1 Tax=Mongoliimonas terrestris TaxID=1709001 RepID=UPI000A57659B|nr:ABC transporter substrate-binding protein [Mongoliimonas terrestris]
MNVRWTMNRVVPAVAVILAMAGTLAPAGAQSTAPATEGAPAAARPKKQAPEPIEVRIGHIRWSKPYVTLSLSKMPPKDDGIAGALMAVEDNNTTGRFTGHNFTLDTREVETPEAALAAATELEAAGAAFILADVPADVLLSLSDASGAENRFIFNVAAKEDALRGASCRANIIHTVPSYAMLADGLAQYLVWKQWPRWFLLTGALPQDKLWSDALKRAATRFGAEIVEEREYQERDTARRTDTGHVQVQRQLPVFTQNAPDHDVVVVADESEIFGEYVPYRTWTPRPVAGSGGLQPTNWSEDHEQWGAYQLQNRFVDLNKRRMRSRDGSAWLAVRMIGEAATRTKSGDKATLISYMRGPDLGVAAFKGSKLTVRSWDNQVRQPVLLADGNTVVSVSPQEGFLHQNTELDTLGYDEPETECKF